MKQLLGMMLLILLITACSAETADDQLETNADSPTQTLDSAESTTIPLSQPDEGQELESELEEAAEREGQGDGSLQESEMSQPEAGESQSESVRPAASQPVPAELPQDSSVAPSGSVDVGSLPRTPAGQSEPGELVVQPIPGVSDPQSKMAEQAIQELANRIDENSEDIEVISVESVEWSDGSLGCPEPGMMYIQAITPGYLVVLEANEEQYEYHTDMSGIVILCQDGRPAPSN